MTKNCTKSKERRGIKTKGLQNCGPSKFILSGKWDLLTNYQLFSLSLEVGTAIRCSFDRGIQLYEDSMNTDYKAR